MKRCKKIMVCLLTLLMMVAFSSIAFAAVDNEGTQTNPNVDNEIIQLDENVAEQADDEASVYVRGNVAFKSMMVEALDSDAGKSKTVYYESYYPYQQAVGATISIDEADELMEEGYDTLKVTYTYTARNASNYEITLDGTTVEKGYYIGDNNKYSYKTPFFEGTQTMKIYLNYRESVGWGSVTIR